MTGICFKGVLFFIFVLLIGCDNNRSIETSIEKSEKPENILSRKKIIQKYVVTETRRFEDYDMSWGPQHVHKQVIVYYVLSDDGHALEISPVVWGALILNRDSVTAETGSWIKVKP